MKKILCICNHGQVRSAALKKAIWEFNGACKDTRDEYRKEYIQYEAIAIGAHCTSDESLILFINWADKIIDLSDNDAHIQNKLKEMAKDKYIRKDIGGDRFGNPFNDELKRIVESIANELK